MTDIDKQRIAADWPPARRFGWKKATMVEPATSHRDDYASRLRRARAIGKAVAWAMRVSRELDGKVPGGKG
jgi:hypothetical protein